MPKVPTYDSFQASPGEAPGARFAQVNANIPNSMPTGAGEIVNKQIGQLGAAMEGAGGKAASILADMEERQSRTEAKAADIQATQLMGDTQFNPQTGYMFLQNKAAVDALPDAEKALTKIGADVAAGLSNNRARQMFDEVFQHRQLSAIEGMRKHAFVQNQKWQMETSEARAVTTLQDAANQPDNPQVFEASLGTAIGEAQSQGKLKGLGDDDPQTKLQAQKYTDMAFKMRYDAWRLKDPVSGLGDFMINAQRVSPLSRENIARDLFHAAAQPLAVIYNATGGAGSVAPPAIGGADQPRGIRNNNPGNIMRSDTQWQGEVAGNDPRYASFETPEAGVRAMGKTLLTYQDTHGINTVQDIVARWAPATENNTASYVSSVAKAMGVNPTQPLDLHNPATLTAITKSIIQFENGKQPYTDQQIASGIAAATGNGSLPTPPKDMPSGNQDTALTGNALIDALPSDWRIHVIQLARAQGAQNRGMVQDQLKTKVQDAQTSYMVNGDAPNPPHEVDFIQAYGQGEGTARYRSFQDVARLGQQIKQVNTLPVASIAQLVDQAKPVPGDGFAEKQHNYEILLSAVDHVQQARKQDPIAYAISTGSYGIKPITSFNTPAVDMQELTNRAAAATQIATDYGTAPVLFTKPEAKALSDTLKASPVERQKQYFSAMYSNIGDMGLFKQTMQAIAPDNPTLAVAGIYQARGLHTTENRDVADLILRGQAILTPNTKTDGSGHMGGKSLIKMPEEKLLLSDWNSATGDAFKGKEQAADLFMQTAKAIYAARSAEDGDYSGDINSKRWKAAINLATGGIGDHNGSKIVMPYGLGYDQFQNNLKDRVDNLVKTSPPLAATTGDLMRLPLENVGDGRYMFRRGAGYVVDKDGHPLVADLNYSGRESSGKIRRAAQ